MQHDNGNARWVTALLNINPMPIADVQHALIERVERRIKIALVLTSIGDLVHNHPI